MRNLIAIILLLVVQPVLGSFDRGIDLYSAYKDCEELGQAEGDDRFEAALSCGIWDGYVSGAFDAYYGLDVFCQPKGINREQVLDIVGAYLKDHPDLRHKPADILIAKALKEAWPCDDVSSSDADYVDL